MKKEVLVIFILLINSVAALEISQQICENNGEVIITLEAEDKNVTYTDQIEVSVEGEILEGEWDINFMKKNPPDRGRQWATFTTKEGVVLGGKKLINVKYPLEFEGSKVIEEVQEVLECPDFLFSCALINMKVNECYTENNVFYGYFTASGFEQSNVAKLDIDENLGFNLYTIDVYEDIEGKIVKNGVKPKNAEIKQVEGDKFVMVFEFSEENVVEKFRVAFTELDRCLHGKYDEYQLRLSDIMECNQPSLENNVDEENLLEKDSAKEDPKIEDIPEQIPISEIIDAEFKPEKEKNDALFASIVIIIIIIGIIVLFKIKKPKM